MELNLDERMERDLKFFVRRYKSAKNDHEKKIVDIDSDDFIERMIMDLNEKQRFKSLYGRLKTY